MNKLFLKLTYDYTRVDCKSGNNFKMWSGHLDKTLEFTPNIYKNVSKLRMWLTKTFTTSRYVEFSMDCINVNHDDFEFYKHNLLYHEPSGKVVRVYNNRTKFTKYYFSKDKETIHHQHCETEGFCNKYNTQDLPISEFRFFRII